MVILVISFARLPLVGVCWVRVRSWRRGEWTSLPSLLEPFDVYSICFLMIFLEEGLRNELELEGRRRDPVQFENGIISVLPLVINCMALSKA